MGSSRKRQHQVTSLIRMINVQCVLYVLIDVTNCSHCRSNLLYVFKKQILKIFYLSFYCFLIVFFNRYKLSVIYKVLYLNLRPV